MHLLDINALIALCDQDHEHHEKTQRWFRRERDYGWSTCPITENGTLRILAQPSYPNALKSVDEAAVVLRNLIAAAPRHEFWPDRISILDRAIIPGFAKARPPMLADLYLLALTVERDACFATLNTRIDPNLVPGGGEALVTIS